MIAKSYISASLHELEKLYLHSKSQKKTIYFSKMALIELCGWIEETFDDIVVRHANRNLLSSHNRDYCKKSIVKKNNGFHYENNVRPMFISLIGLIEVEKLENELEKTARITLLKSYLENLKGIRNDAAHTHLKGITKTYNAPSKIMGDYINILSILEEIDKWLRNA
ncbi:endoribonuclease [Pedobacter endophyticus]|uniref:Endoribonuclease n=1 Tax=Pedobacter endophyticus TaxID=2789740 RepID=A0A7S9Q070_9SPHI|nr:endoribonuclease [Pedobacter endophyticus]QPH40670.1 endoribonuclease [Pedobacter endophyticus]